MKIRTRFAPSPTGYLHIGGARTALFSWLLARKHGGEFILRIEDTDRERSTQEAVDAILEGMSWLGLDYDEGPFYQTDRFDRYNEIIQKLLDEGHAYHCLCSKQTLADMREEQMRKGENPGYDRRCRELNKRSAPEDGSVIRFKMPTEGTVVFNDLVRGEIKINNAELDDLIIARSDGTPTYNLTVAVDDHDMEITHVVRGEDHISNTPKQINILNAMGVNIPKYAHVPMILGEDGKRLSKRHGAVGVMQYHQDGTLSQALVNYLVRLGWASGDKEIFSRDEMIELFDVADVNKAGSIFNFEKFMWLNQHYIKTLDTDYLAGELKMQYESLAIDLSGGPALSEIVGAFRDRAKTMKEMAENSVYFFQEFESYDTKAQKKCFGAKAIEPLLAIHSALLLVPENSWEPLSIKAAILKTAENLDVGMGKIGQPLRLAVTGSSSSPSIEITLALIGQKRTLSRIDKAIKLSEEIASKT